MLSGRPKDRPVWLFIDELGSLEQMRSLESALTKGRKHGLRVVACLQSTSQLTDLYGEARSVTLRSCFRSLLALGGSAIGSYALACLALRDEEGKEIELNFISRRG